MRTTSLTALVVACSALAGSRAADAATTRCSIPQACAYFENAGTGPASESDSNSGPGVLGTTDSGYYLDPAVEGESQNPDGSDAAGAFGLNIYSGGAAPAYGILAYGSADGAYGETEGAGTSASEGVEGYDNGGAFQQDLNSGVLGYSSYGTGVVGEANGAPSDHAFGTDQIGAYFVGDSSPVTEGNGTYYSNGIGVLAESNSTAIQAENSITGDHISLGTPSGPFNSGALVYAYSGGGKGSMTVNESGDELLSGYLSATTVYTSKGTYVRTRSATGRPKIAYGAQVTAPQMEDVGDGQLANGHAYVPIDGALADVIDRHASYHVFLTPKGDCNGLYVTQETSSGFVVRELHGGNSSLAFDYRIVVKPLGEDGTRLAAAPAQPRMPQPPSAGEKSLRSIPRAETPLHRLERILGPIRAQRAMQAFVAEHKTH